MKYFHVIRAVLGGFGGPGHGPRGHLRGAKIETGKDKKEKKQGGGKKKDKKEKRGTQGRKLHVCKFGEGVRVTFFNFSSRGAN